MHYEKKKKKKKMIPPWNVPLHRTMKTPRKATLPTLYRRKTTIDVSNVERETRVSTN